ncbi:SurA N-terminal domain-containing protein [Cognatishimia maritima]|uniref:Peptidyl-prolyl cis-trans isomerase D n=1 Tax=Cognatishimia maritima TaxID=870908 RepID=A0A1M5J7P5_9RHOB|nr:SurA N-terminal domain-containing protein [Cognatishimia maritima]SHG36562.1 peptidyl-prolyl cis-trans isomerase D [Cognatishimia maritima]
MSKNNSFSKTMVWILMGMLILGLGGFGITNLGGAVQSVGKVDGKPVSVNDYYRAVQQELDAIQAQTGQRITFAQAQQFGLHQQVLARLVNQRALDAEAERLGLSMGDENLRDQIVNISAFQGLDGSFDREAYRFALQNSGLNERAFEDSLREDAARTLLQSAIIGGVDMPDAYAEALARYLGEQRSFSYATLTEADLDAEIAAPDEAALQAHYDANQSNFMQPATRDITYAWIAPAMLLDSVEVDEASLQALYEDRSAEFNQPERRLVERLVYGTAADAETALAKITASETTFDDEVTARGLELADVDMGDVTQSALGAAGEGVFAADTGDVVGPFQTDLGPALFRVNAILEAQSVTFEEVEADLRDELATDRARRVIEAQINTVDDLLAAGATLEDVAAETDLELGSIKFHVGSEDAIAGYADFRAAAQRIQDGDFPEVTTLDDGGIFALRLDGTSEAAPIPFADAREAVEADWRATAVREALKAQADSLIERMKAGEDIITLRLIVAQEQDLTRNDFLPDVPATLLETVFGMDQGDIEAVAGNGSYLIVELDDIAAADLSAGENTTIVNLIGQQVSQSLTQDILDAYSNFIRSRAEIEIDQGALAAVHAQLN